MEVIGEGSFPLVGGWHVGGETLRTPLALTQTARTAHCIGAIGPCGWRRWGGGWRRAKHVRCCTNQKRIIQVIWMNENALPVSTMRRTRRGGDGEFLGRVSMSTLFCLVVMMMDGDTGGMMVLEQHLKTPQTLKWQKLIHFWIVNTAFSADYHSGLFFDHKMALELR